MPQRRLGSLTGLLPPEAKRSRMDWKFLMQAAHVMRQSLPQFPDVIKDLTKTLQNPYSAHAPIYGYAMSDLEGVLGPAPFLQWYWPNQSFSQAPLQGGPSCCISMVEDVQVGYTNGPNTECSIAPHSLPGRAGRVCDHLGGQACRGDVD